MPFHLLFPLFSSIVFVIGMMFAKRAISAGASPWTGTFLANIWLALLWACVCLILGKYPTGHGWWQAALVGATFVTGQVFTYLAFQYGDVSVATPVFGTKVIIVAILAAVLAGDHIAGHIWMSACLAAVGVALVQSGVKRGGHSSSHGSGRAALTIILVLAAALMMSLFDIGLQVWGRQQGAAGFLPVMFVSTGILSCLLIPWIDPPRRLLSRKLLKPISCGTLLMAFQAISMSYVLSAYGDTVRVNIVYSLRGLWAVLLGWSLARFFQGGEAGLPVRVLWLRLCGSGLLTASVVMALWPSL